MGRLCGCSAEGACDVNLSGRDSRLPLPCLSCSALPRDSELARSASKQYGSRGIGSPADGALQTEQGWKIPLVPSRFPSCSLLAQT